MNKQIKFKKIDNQAKIKGYLKMTSSNVNSLNLIKDRLIKSQNKSKYFTGPISFPTKKYVVPVRRSPCGRGSGTFDHFKRIQYKTMYLIKNFEAIDTIFPALSDIVDVSYSINFNF